MSVISIIVEIFVTPRVNPCRHFLGDEFILFYDQISHLVNIVPRPNVRNSTDNRISAGLPEALDLSRCYARSCLFNDCSGVPNVAPLIPMRFRLRFRN